MYLYPDFNQISNGNNLNHFVQDLHSGKLHREFHNGPDPTQAPRVIIMINICRMVCLLSFFFIN